jgi:hypothetical protein
VLYCPTYSTTKQAIRLFILHQTTSYENKLNVNKLMTGEAAA